MVSRLEHVIKDEWSLRLGEDFQWVRTEKDEHKYWQDFYTCALDRIGNRLDRRKAVSFLAEKTADPESFTCFPEVRWTLGILAQRRFTLGIISNAFPSTRRILAYLRLTDLFDLIVLSYEYGGPTAKPKPDIYLYALERVRLDPAYALFVDDRPAFVQGALTKDVAMRAVLIDRDSQQQKWGGWRINSLAEIPPSCRLLRPKLNSYRHDSPRGFAARLSDLWLAIHPSSYTSRTHRMTFDVPYPGDLEPRSRRARPKTGSLP
jgi:HAD superfamily hydrolase (TIGR01509 family)